MFIHQIAFKNMRQNHWTMKYRSQWPTSFFSGPCLILTRGEIYSTVNGVPLHTAFHYHPNIVLIWLKYCWKGRKIASHPSIHTSFLRSSIKSYWLITPRYHVYISINLEDTTQNHWTMKYRSQWSIFILRSSIKSYWLISPSYHIYTSNSLQDIRQNHWTMKYKSQWPTFILR